MRFGDDAERIGDADVDAVDVFGGRESRFVFDDALDIEEAFLEDLILRIEESLFAFRVAWRDSPVEGGEEDKPRPFLRFQHTVSPRSSPVMAPGLIWTLTRMFFPVVE